MDELFTMSEMASILKTPDSTVRSHCQRFREYIPYTGEGRERRYLPDALTVLRVVAECYERNMTTAQIRAHLAQEFAVTVEQQQSVATQLQGIEQQQQSTFTQQQAMAMLLLVVAECQRVTGELGEVKDRLAAMEQQQATAKRDVDGFIAEWRAKKNRPWWRRWFG